MERNIQSSGLSGVKIYLTGARGMLAGDLVPALVQAGAELRLSDLVAGSRAGLEIAEIDLTNAEQVRADIRSFSPQWVVNCAAYTQVDKAETDYTTAFSVNASAVETLARSAQECRAFMLHVSTDYVFGGRKTVGAPHPIAETEPPAPCGIYGHSKHLGERLLMNILPEQFLLVRTSWLHGVHGPNFIDTMLKLSRERQSLKVVSDQRGSPTWTGWLSSVLVRLMEMNSRGIFHASSRGGITWFEFAKEIFHQAHIPMEVLPQTTEELARPAPRPAYSVLELAKLEHVLGEVSISWQDGIAKHLAAKLAINE